MNFFFSAYCQFQLLTSLLDCNILSLLLVFHGSYIIQQKRAVACLFRVSARSFLFGVVQQPLLYLDLRTVGERVVLHERLLHGLHAARRRLRTQ